MEELKSPSTDVGPGQSLHETEPRRLWMQFTGSASEYFRIWIVNVALTIITLGIYSAWAKVRTKNYFYKHTVLDGSCFEYHAVPRQILKGRIIVAAFLAAIALAKIYSLKLYAAGLVVLFCVSPAIVVLALAFNARNSSYRNVRFSFDGTVKSAYRTYLIGAAVYILTIALGFPYFQWRIVKFAISHYRYGNQQFYFSATPRQFFRVYGLAMGLLLLTVPVWLLVMLVFRGVASEAGGMVTILLMYGAVFLVAGYVKARQSNLVFGSISISADATSPLEASADPTTTDALGRHFVESDQRAGQVIWLYVSNLLGIVATAGLLIPWAKVRMARYRAEHLHVLANGDLVAFGSSAPSRRGVMADAATDLGDIGFDLGI